MPHLVILYSGNLDAPEADGGTDMRALCRSLADAMLTIHDEGGRQVFPTGGTRVLAFPAAHWAIADGGDAGEAVGMGRDYAFVYLNLRMGRGRSAAVQKRSGGALEAVARQHFAEQLTRRPIGITVQVDEGPEVFDAKISSLHPLFTPLRST
ncbi:MULTISPECIES: 5-carboxymethyl-2-hydroxymuconate Delta-isomerase [Hydrogenophaga]|jgi:5-carboxymethyl-2-hydroxymuconate isomerase|uniref:HpaF protein n=1 Tax=Hydrogenophaga intermedia TaxID=65786 RepID=A0A1L1PND7_HYDIT|nr:MULTISPECIES: 5-carboxymethyl-2-hydroxymuconate Delta-isomerase [Hydrogenophaga]AOS81304.1 5-carboxymethyl-2-hydroxymuconate isomerase [Hydrogenophaga sp. PBC]TMU74237.1 5-carboxymethyl-2-hydroxymuconate Delta-isomerase [Hydrogenophaga intermedia]CDN90314.1 HpaF protein [Hydrogenophaga intermedia]